MVKCKWFDRYIGCAFGCAFNIPDRELIFDGVAANTETKSGLPLQYIFHGAESNEEAVVFYAEARRVMGAMIEANTYNIKEGNKK